MPIMNFITNLQTSMILEDKLFYEVSGEDAILYLDKDKQHFLGVAMTFTELYEYCMLKSSQGDTIRIYYEEFPLFMLFRGFVFFDSRCEHFRATNPFTQQLLDMLLVRI